MTATAIEAAQALDLEALRAALDAGGAPAPAPAGTDQAIHHAARRAFLPGVTLLLDRGAKAGARGAGGQTPLHVTDDADVGRLLIARGAPVDARDDHGRQPLHEAIWPELTRVLLAAGANVRVKDKEGLTPLHRACARAKSAGVVRAMLTHGADPDAPTPAGETPLLLAAANPHETYPIIAVLLASGADVRAAGPKGETALHRAASFKFQYRYSLRSLTKLLARAGADPRARDKAGQTPRDLFKRKKVFGGLFSLDEFDALFEQPAATDS
jgi:ankyrin repeat protein